MQNNSTNPIRSASRYIQAEAVDLSETCPSRGGRLERGSVEHCKKSKGSSSPETTVAQERDSRPPEKTAVRGHATDPEVNPGCKRGELLESALEKRNSLRFSEWRPDDETRTPGAAAIARGASSRMVQGTV